jgi:hypothetical protein
MSAGHLLTLSPPFESRQRNMEKENKTHFHPPALAFVSKGRLWTGGELFGYLFTIG